MPALPFNNDQASLGIRQLVLLQGSFPPRDGSSDPDGLYLGSLRSFAGDFAWGGTTFADGQLLPIAQNTALFTILGTTFGGNGQTTFALPDLRGRAMVGAATLSGEGIKFGSDVATLTSVNMPAGGAQPFVNDQPSLTINYFINAYGVAPGIGSSSPDVVGMVVPFLGTFAPKGYLHADGSTLNISSFPLLYAQIGTTYGGNGTTTFNLPDLRGKTIIGDSPQHALGSVVGQDQTIITTANLPASVGGSGTPIDNHQPSIALHYIIALQGQYPASDSVTVDSNENGVGEIMAYAGTTIPNGWALANGQLLPINQNMALWSLIGTTYGGNGTTTFALPDLRNRTAIEAGEGPGLSKVYHGIPYGNDAITLTENSLPLPTVTINQAASQGDPSAPHAVVFDVVFSENVTGFAASDIVLSGTAGATTKTIIPGIDAAHYTVSVGGMTQAGTVIASIVNKAVDSVANGLPSKVSTSTDNTVTYFDHQFAQPTLKLAAFNPANGWTSQDQFPRHLADVTGEGNADIVAFGNGGVYVAKAANDGTFGTPAIVLAAFNPANGWTSDNLFHRELADVSGDHRADIVGFGNGGVYVALARGVGDGGFNTQTIVLNAFNPANGWTSQDQFPRQLADVSGDGKADIVAFGDGGIYVALANTNGNGGFNAATIVRDAFNPGNGWTSQDSFPRVLGDVDGDGKADIVAFGNGGVYVSLATGNGNFAAPFIDIAALNPANGWTSQNQFPRLLTDVNRDGKSDIVAFGNGGVYVAYATGGGHFEAPRIDLSAFNPANGWTSDNQFHRELADIDHDGFADIVGFGIPGVLTAMNYDLV